MEQPNGCDRIMGESSSAALVYTVVYCLPSTSHLVYLLLSARSLNIRRAGLSLSDKDTGWQVRLTNGYYSVAAMTLL